MLAQQVNWDSSDITHETAIAAGVRRLEALSGEAAEKYFREQRKQLDAIREQFKNPKDIVKSIENAATENADLKKKLEHMENRMLVGLRNELLQKDEIINGVNFIGDIVEVNNADALKKLCLDLKNNLNNHVAVLCANIGGKPSVAIGISDTVVKAKGSMQERSLRKRSLLLLKAVVAAKKISRLPAARTRAI